MAAGGRHGCIFLRVAQMSRIFLIACLALLLGGCHPNRSLPPTPQLTPVPTTLNRLIDAALDKAGRFLVTKQSEDGAWRSEVYGFLKDGPSLTPHVAVMLMQLPDDRPTDQAVQKARRYLQTVG